MRRLAVLLATSGGVGYAPIAPGTAGSAVGLAVYFLTWHWTATAQVALVTLISIVGVWAAGEGARHFQREDPGPVVIDEVAGQLATLLLTGAGLAAAIIGFVIFRVLDVFKPWPARWLERLPGGWGIMADDLMVSIYGNLLVRLLLVGAAGLTLTSRP